MVQAAVPPSTAPSASPSPIPSKNPLPLSAFQEGQVRELYYARVRGLCAEEIKQFAACAWGRTVSAPWACRAERKGMNSCMVAHATPENQDAAREEWFRRKTEKRRMKEEAAAAAETAEVDPVVGPVEVVKDRRRRTEEKILKEKVVRL